MGSYRRNILMLAAAATCCLATAPAWADVKTGVDSWQAGNYEGAVREWRPLAEKGDADAQFNMGQAYKLGRGVPSDLKLAQTWYEKAAQQGHEQAQANLGLILFQNGDRAAAMPWIRKAADHGDPRAQYVLATALFNGDFVTKDWPTAYALMTRAAAQGLPQAATSLTEMDQFIPLPDRQKGVALAQKMGGTATVLASNAGPATPPAKAKPAPPQAKPATTTPKPVPLPPSRVAAASPAPVAPAPPKPAATSLAAAGGKWRVQLGAFASPEIARSQWASLSRRIGALAGLQPFYEPYGGLTRLRVGPLGGRAAADKLCAASKSAGQACFPVAP